MKDKRTTPIEMGQQEFRKIGYQLIDKISNFISTINDRPITRGESALEINKILGDESLPKHGTSANDLLVKTSNLLFDHSLLNGHPKFLGFITSSAAPIGALADLLAASVNPNVGARILSPIATGIEQQTIKWLAEFIGVSPNYGGVLVSGGNMANFTAFLAARTAKTSEHFKKEGMSGTSKRMTIYCSKTTHTWIEKATILFGHGLNSVRWIPANSKNQMDISILDKTIKEDIKNGNQPFIVVGTAGDVSTGAVDDLSAISEVCKEYDLWFHIDGAYGVPAAVISELKPMFEGIEQADSIALDPHKWLYSPLEAGCTLVKNPQHLVDTYSSHPEYYNFNKNEKELSQNFYEYGLQNSRGFRALKVWLALKQVGKTGYVKMFQQDIELSKLLFEFANNHAELEAITQNLSIATFRYAPSDTILKEENLEAYLNLLNETLLNKLQKGGEVFLSNAIVGGKYCLRSCIVNFRTSKKDIEEIIEIIIREGKKIHQEFQTKEMLTSNPI